jgi:hypothetical protein
LRCSGYQKDQIWRRLGLDRNRVYWLHGTKAHTSITLDWIVSFNLLAVAQAPATLLSFHIGSWKLKFETGARYIIADSVEDIHLGTAEWTLSARFRSDCTPISGGLPYSYRRAQILHTQSWTFLFRKTLATHLETLDLSTEFACPFYPRFRPGSTLRLGFRRLLLPSRQPSSLSKEQETRSLQRRYPRQLFGSTCRPIPRFRPNSSFRLGYRVAPLGSSNRLETSRLFHDISTFHVAT